MAFDTVPTFVTVTLTSSRLEDLSSNMSVSLRLMPPTASAPEDWWGGLNLTYGVGPGPARPGWTVELDIHTHGQRANATNVIATLRGYEEPGGWR